MFLFTLATLDLHADLIPWLSNYSRLVASSGAYRMYELAAALQRVQLPQPPAEETENLAQSNAMTVDSKGGGETRQRQDAHDGEEVSARPGPRTADVAEIEETLASDSFVVDLDVELVLVFPSHDALRAHFMRQNERQAQKGVEREARQVAPY